MTVRPQRGPCIGQGRAGPTSVSGWPRRAGRSCHRARPRPSRGGPGGRLDAALAGILVALRPGLGLAQEHDPLLDGHAVRDRGPQPRVIGATQRRTHGPDPRTRALIHPDNHAGAVRTPRRGDDLLPVTAQDVGFSRSIAIPDPRGLIFGRGQDVRAIGAEPRKIELLLVTAKDHGRPRAVRVPDPRGLVVRCGEDALAVGAPCDPGGGLLVTAKHHRLPRRIDVPHAHHRVIQPSAGDALAVGAPRDHRDGSVVGAMVLRFPRTAGVPHPQRAVTGPRGHTLAVGAERNCPDLVCGDVQDHRPCCARCIHFAAGSESAPIVQRCQGPHLRDRRGPPRGAPGSATRMRSCLRRRARRRSPVRPGAGYRYRSASETQLRRRELQERQRTLRLLEPAHHRLDHGLVLEPIACCQERPGQRGAQPVAPHRQKEAQPARHLGDEVALFAPSDTESPSARRA